MPSSRFRSLPHATKAAIKFVALSLSLIVVCIIVFVIVASHLAVKPLNFTAPDVSPYLAAVCDLVSQFNRFFYLLFLGQVSFSTELISADATARTLVMDWYPALTFDCNSSPAFVADIYLDP